MKGLKKRHEQVICTAIAAGLLILNGCSRGTYTIHTQERQELSTEQAISKTERVSALTQEQNGLETVTWAAAPVITTNRWLDNRFSEDNTLLAMGEFRGLEIIGEGYEAVTKAVREMFFEKEDAFTKNMDLLEEHARERYALSMEEDWLNFVSPYRYWQEWVTTRADRNIISLCGSFSEYSGGVHEMQWTSGATFDANTGEKLEFYDLTNDPEGFREKTLEHCLKVAKEIYEEGEELLFDEYETLIRNYWEEGPEWCLDAAGIRIIFSPYEIGPFAAGTIYLHLSYAELEDLLLPKYTMGNYAGIAELPEGVEAKVSLGRMTGEKETICLFAKKAEKDFEFGTYYLIIGDTAEEVTGFERHFDTGYLIQREDGRSFLFFDVDVASSDYITYVYEITDGKIKKTWQSDEISAFIGRGGVTPQGTELGIRIDTLGTYTAFGEYALTEDGLLEPVGEWYSIGERYSTIEWYKAVTDAVLTNIRELPVTVNSDSKVLPVGSRLQITGTNRNGILTYKMADSAEEGEIRYTTGESGWPIYIDGLNEMEYFEDLPYAG